ncbi:unnamed protein product [Effrenium voratum]|nr:unnamed protein product [Effrenium voratum]
MLGPVPLSAFELSTLIAKRGKSQEWAFLCGLLDRTAVQLDVVCLSAAMQLFNRVCQWQRALALIGLMAHRCIKPNERSYTAGIRACEKALLWQPTMQMLHRMSSVNLEKNHFVQSAALSTCDSTGQWSVAARLVDTAPCNAVVFNSALAALGHSWRAALSLRRGLQLDSISYNTLGTALERNSRWQKSVSTLLSSNLLDQVGRNCVARALGARWQRALGFLTWSAVGCGTVMGSCHWRQAQQLMRNMLSRGLVPNSIIHGALLTTLSQEDFWSRSLHQLRRREVEGVALNTVLTSCRRGGRWPLCLFLLSGMPIWRLRPDHISESEVVSACESGGEWQTTLALLESQAPGNMDEMTVETVRREAQLWRRGARDTAGNASLGGPTPLAQMGALLWSVASLLATDSISVSALAAAGEIRGGFRRLSTASLANLAWAVGTLKVAPELLLGTGDELLNRTLCPSVAEALITVTWARAQLGAAGPRASAALEALRRLGRARDEPLPLDPPPQPTALTRGVRVGPEPTAVELENCLVIRKPSGWQIYDSLEQGRPDQSRGNLTSFVQSLKRRPILKDFACKLGFLHRLDVPSSGLILVATSYSSYYQLRWQLASGEMGRDYQVLGHGWLRSRSCSAPLLWPTRADEARATRTRVPRGRSGWPALTKVTAERHGLHDGGAFTLTAIRIGTGRRHQIRVHLAHCGFPSVSDGKYSSHATYQEDQAFCPRNFLHRHRLSFTLGERKCVIEPLPDDLARALQKIRVIRSPEASRENMQT